MKNSRRAVLIILLVCLLLPLAYLFRDFLLENLVRPVALVLWLVWQVLLSFDQRVIWSVLIFAALMVGILRLALQGLSDIKPAPAPDSHLTLANIEYWRTFILMTADEQAQVNIMKQNLLEILTALYTSRNPETPHWEVVEALKQRQIPLPDAIYAFLFPPRPLAGRPSFKQMLQSLQRLPARWARQSSGRAAAEYYQSIDEVLTFMESSLEINHADK
jgi:hypothetical protein